MSKLIYIDIKKIMFVFYKTLQYILINSNNFLQNLEKRSKIIWLSIHSL